MAAGDGPAAPFEVLDRDLGRVALRSAHRFLSAKPDGKVVIRDAVPDVAETFQWIETFTGELTLLSLSTHRYVRFEAATGALAADSPGRTPTAATASGGSGGRRHLLSSRCHE